MTIIHMGNYFLLLPYTSRRTFSANNLDFHLINNTG